MKRFLIILLSAWLAGACIPKKEVKLVRVENLQLQNGSQGAMLAGNAVFFNPNTARLKLREVSIDVLVDNKKAARIDQQLNALAKGNSEFSVPLEVQLNLKEFGLMDALQGLFGGKKYQIQYIGYLKVRVNGLPMRIPVNHKEEFKMRF
jgi:LEA14-like dessication related protein